MACSLLPSCAPLSPSPRLHSSSWPELCLCCVPRPASPTARAPGHRGGGGRGTPRRDCRRLPRVAAAVSNLSIIVAGSPVLLSGLSASGFVAAFLLGTLTWRAFGPRGLILVTSYFVAVNGSADPGTAATKLKIKRKEDLGVAEKRGGRRGPGSVIGSSAAGCVCALLSIYNSRYLVTTFKVVPRGTEGAISIEGTLAGALASIILASVGYLLGQVNVSQGAVCVIASHIANFFESYIGATLQDKEGFEWLNNDVVNVLNISTGAILAVLMQQLLIPA
ncbi:hypothetical protein GUJ93_ZPchr0007g6097 [Zizania palustris]|uniref:Protein PGR n=1 Tax=Zizania palustris TaxID=103762 RepID=A0A8J5SPT4_ZIZPA|nr:hypothetical protein GUJ93_ZPchr0007g6097 [Zizania palustris]